MTPLTARVLVLAPTEPRLSDTATFAGLVRAFGQVAEELQIDLFLDQETPASVPFRTSTIATINEAYDLVLFSGADLFTPRDTASGWAFDIDSESLAELRVPFAVAAARRGHANSHAMEAHLCRLIPRAAHFSARTRADAVWFSRLSSRLVTAMADEAVFLVPPEVAPIHLPADRPCVGITTDFSSASYDVDVPLEANMEAFATGLVDAARTMIRERGAMIVFAPTSDEPGIDRQLGELLEASLPPKDFTSLPTVRPDLYGTDVGERIAALLGLYAKLDALAFHGGPALALAGGCPSVVIGANAMRDETNELFGDGAARFMAFSDFVGRETESLATRMGALFAEGEGCAELMRRRMEVQVQGRRQLADLCRVAVGVSYHGAVESGAAL